MPAMMSPIACVSVQSIALRMHKMFPIVIVAAGRQRWMAQAMQEGRSPFDYS